MAAAAIANIVKSSLGPVGLDKMLVDDVGVSLKGFKIFIFLRLYYSREDALCSVRNRSGIIAQHGLSNAKPSIADLILQLPETNF